MVKMCEAQCVTRHHMFWFLIIYLFTYLVLCCVDHSTYVFGYI